MLIGLKVYKKKEVREKEKEKEKVCLPGQEQREERE